MRVLLAGLAALALFLGMNFVQDNGLVPAAGDVAIVAAAADLGVTTALNGVVVTGKFDSQALEKFSTSAGALTGADVITISRAKWGYGAHTARQFAAASDYYYSGYSDSRTRHAATSADLNRREAGWSPGAHTERLHRLGEFLNFA